MTHNDGFLHHPKPLICSRRTYPVRATDGANCTGKARLVHLLNKKIVLHKGILNLRLFKIAPHSQVSAFVNTRFLSGKVDLT